ncbi:MAG: hypothetical protein ACK4NF_07205, partial [Planctomycetota bacterium]
KLPVLIDEVKSRHLLPTMPPPTYDELCKDIKVEGRDGLPKIDICQEAAKRCQPKCTKKEQDKDILDTTCFNNCIKEAGCEPK